VNSALTNSAKLTDMAIKRSPNDEEWISPIGQSVEDFNAEQERLYPEYRKEAERVGHLFDFAKIVLLRRAELGLTQQELAERMGTSHSVISRLEGGRHNFSLTTMRRLADALDVKLVYGFEVEGGDRSLVVVP
jgi:ribosome-binding protein aMBF1 (putative translation factor)